MLEERESYDQSITIYSPDGRMFQVEYAREAIKKGSISLGMVYDKGIIMLVEKRLPSKLIINKSVEKFFKITKNILCATSGLIADGRILADFTREEANSYKIKYDEEITVTELVKRVCNLKRIYTQYGGVRPFGVSFIIGGIDTEGLHLFETDPSGAYKKYFAGIIGESTDEVNELLENEYKQNMKFNAAINLAFKATSVALNKKIKDVKLEIMTISESDQVNKLTEEEIQNLKKAYKKK
jgi:proteasome alpha subunit